MDRRRRIIDDPGSGVGDDHTKQKPRLCWNLKFFISADLKSLRQENGCAAAFLGWWSGRTRIVSVRFGVAGRRRWLLKYRS